MPATETRIQAEGAVAEEMMARRVAERVLMIGVRRRFPNDEELPAEAALWGRLGRVLTEAEADRGCEARQLLRHALRQLDDVDVPDPLRRQVAQFGEGIAG